MATTLPPYQLRKTAPPQDWYTGCGPAIRRADWFIEDRTAKDFACDRDTFITLHQSGGQGTFEAWKRLPRSLRYVRDSIEDSRRILDLAENWDDEGAQPIREPTWTRAVQFLASQARSLWETSGKLLDPPDICPVPNGSIDLHWDHAGYELLINIPADETAMAGFYGDDKARIYIRGEFDTDRVSEALVLWLLKS